MEIAYAKRQAQLQGMDGVAAVAIVPGANMVYFTGLHFHLSERPIVALFTAKEGLSIIIPELETPKLSARPDLAATAFVWNDTDGHQEAFEAAVNALNLRGKTLGVDGLTMRVTEWLAFQAIDPAMQVRAIERDIIKIRAYKTADEIAALRKAIGFTEDVLGRLQEWVEPGMSEKAIAERLAKELRQAGCDNVSFEPLVQTGPNSALPHGMPGERALQEGEFLLIDFGGTVDGYPADITRTFCIGEPSGEMQKVYDVVLRANEAAKAIAGPGVPMGDVDKAARDVITEAGYGEYFIHRTGHGLGLDVHEPIPQIASGVSDLLEAGMVFTIEPGVYIPDLGGVRIEDNVVVTENGLDVLTSYPRTLTG